MQTIILGNGCFWCTESIFQKLKGVSLVESGYAGGEVKNPSYEQVCSGRTGHAEVIKISYEPEIISYEALLKVFFETHDPTTLNKQGNDRGTQYRSVIFYNSLQEKEVAEKFISGLNQSGIYKDPVVTQVVPVPEFFKAENYHQNYFNLNGHNPYCEMVIRPKLDKFLAHSPDLLMK
jgi:peptide-methionine (S)-S-oxide reductase